MRVNAGARIARHACSRTRGGHAELPSPRRPAYLRGMTLRPAAPAPLLAATLFLAAILPDGAPAQDRDLRVCADPDAPAQSVVQACTRALESGRLRREASARALVNLGAAQAELGNLSPALAAYDEAARRDPRLFDIYPNRAWVLERLGRIADALGDYDRALAMKPQDAVTLIGRGNLLLRRGEAAKALADFDRALASEPRNVEARFNRALAAAALGRRAEAVRDLSALLAERPDDAAAWLERARIRAADEPERALADATNAINRAPEWAEAFVVRGRILDQQGRRAEADRDFLRAFELGYQAGWLTERITALRGG